MKHGALRKNFWREIRGSKGRFLSIFCIVFLGTAFFAGIRATEPDMRYSGDAYLDEHQLMDIQVQSTLGLTTEDVQALENVKGAKKVEAGYSVDVLCDNHEGQDVLHVMSLLPTMNQVEVAEGRLPEAENECLVDADFLKDSDYELGDQITLHSGTEESLSDSLSTETFTIVGSGYSPCYISLYRGSASIGTGSVKGFVYVPEDSFSMDVYTEIYVQAKGAKQLTAFTEEYDALVDQVKDQIEEIKDSRQEARYQEVVGDATEKLDEARAEYESAKQEAQDQLDAALAELQSGQAQLESAKSQLASGRQQIQAAETELNNSQAELNTGLQTIQEKQKEIEQGRTQLQSAKSQLESGIAQIQEQLPLLQQQYEQMKAAGADQETLQQLETQIAELQNQLTTLQVQQGELATQEAQLDAGQQEIDASRAQLEASQAQLDAGRTELEQKKAELESGQQEIAASEQTLAEGQASYDSAAAEAESKLAEGEQELQDAENEITKIENAKWYINDRSALTEYTGYGENADRMRAIGQVFPVLFFLVAALISLTTMTRMVEEQRTEIGTLKALGYSRTRISVKYLGYAFLATITGSICGVLAGEKLLPRIIIKAYGIMYPHLDTVRVPYERYYAVLAVIIATLCTMGAAWFACVKELHGTAAELMRPPAPKNGKRVFLEKITFLWKRLSFIWKATVRNLFRYKKRFFMTISGIGGCMALLLVGYGLEDSISNIARLQYQEIQRYDASLILNTSSSEEEQEKAVEQLESDKSVDSAREIMMEQLSVSHGKKKLDVYLDIPEDEEAYKDFVTLRDRESHEAYELDDSGAILSEKAAKLLGVEVGDEIVIRDDIQGEIRIQISHICENYMGHYLYMSPSLYEKLFQRSPEYNAVCFRMKSGKEEQLESVGEEILKMDGAFSISYVAEIQDQVDSMLVSLDSVMGVIILFAGMLAFVVLYNLNNINITERRRELATLKVLGFYDLEVAAYVYRENVLLTIVGSAVGCVLGKWLHRFVIETVEIDTVMFGRNIEFGSFVTGVLLTIGFSCFVNWIMFFKLKKIDMVESLKSVE